MTKEQSDLDKLTEVMRMTNVAMTLMYLDFSKEEDCEVMRRITKQLREDDVCEV